MRLNTIKPAEGARQSKKRVGRGMGSGLGKTCGRGHKGQKSRAGGYHKVGFEGGQMPIQRRVPKFGFRSRTSRFNAEVRLSELDKLEATEIDLDLLIQAKVVPQQTKSAKVILSGELSRAVQLTGVRVTSGAKSAIEAAGGSVA